MILPCRPLGLPAPRPSYAHPGDAGLDLHAAIAEPLTLAPGERAVIDTGWAFAIPEGYAGLVLPRSGLSKRGIDVKAGVIDSSFRGSVGVTLSNESRAAYVVEPGSRVGQLVIVPCARVELVEVEALGETSRGGGGFGSTGR